MDTYHGQVKTPQDAIVLFEACRLGILPRVQRRLSERERQQITSGSIFVWDEREAGMRRWTDGKSWSASRVSGSFLTYREMEGRRGAGSSSDQDGNEDGPDGFRYKPDGLTKLSFSITTSDGQHLHLISYFARSDPSTQTLKQPSLDPSLLDIRPAQGVYPESTINDYQTTAGAVQGPTTPFAYNLAQHHPSLYGAPHNLAQGYDQTSNGYTITASHPDAVPFHPRSPDGSFAVQPISHPLAHHNPQPLQTVFRNGLMSDRYAQSNGQVSSPIGWQNNGYEVRASSKELSPSIITDFGDARCSRYPSSSTAPSPGSDEKSQDISPRTPSHPAVAMPGTTVMDMDSSAVVDSRQEDYQHISPNTNLSIEAIIHRDDPSAKVASSSDVRNYRRVNRADSKSPGLSGRGPLGTQEIFNETYEFAEDKRVLRQLDNIAFSNKKS